MKLILRFHSAVILVRMGPARQVVFNEFNSGQCHAVRSVLYPFCRFVRIDICRLACATQNNRRKLKGYWDRFPPRFYICRRQRTVDAAICLLSHLFVMARRIIFNSKHHFQFVYLYRSPTHHLIARASLASAPAQNFSFEFILYSHFFFETRNGRWADKQFNSLKWCDCAAEWEWVVYVIDALAFFLSSRAMMRRSKLDVRRDEMHSLRFHQYCSFVWWKMIFSRGKSVDKQPILLNYWTANSIVLFANRIVFCVVFKSPPFQVERRAN